MVDICDMVTVDFVDLEKISRQANKQTNKQKTENQQRRKAANKQTERKKDKPTKQKDYTSPAPAGAITREPLSKGDSRMGLIAFHIQLPKM